VKILIVRFSSIGDIVLTTPVVRAMHEQLADVEIHFITKKSFSSLLKENPRISKLYTIDKSISEVISDLKAEKYDIVIDLHKNIRTFQLKQKLGVKSYSFDKLNFQKWLLVNFKRNKMPDLHIVDRYFGAVKEIGVVNDHKNCELIFNAEHTVDVQTSLGLMPKSYLAVAIGAQFATKTMPVDLLTAILSKINIPIVLLGGPTDTERGNELSERLKNHTHPVVNTINQFSLLQSASIVAQAKTILTHDTGLMHIATTFEIPIVSVWGNTVPELGMYPYYPNNKELYSIHEVKNLSCRPCSKIGYKSCPKKHFNCMTLQDTNAIIEDINHRIN
jgi:ADP-heptose:LPS heptosyltransferase